MNYKPTASRNFNMDHNVNIRTVLYCDSSL